MTNDQRSTIAPEIAHKLNELTFLVAFLCKELGANYLTRAQKDMSKLALENLGHSIIAQGDNKRQVNAMLTKCFISVLHDSLA